MLHVEVLGDGPDVVLLHGTPTSPGHLRPLAKALSSQWRTHLVHLPGCGESAPLVPYDLEESHGLVEEALLRAGARSASVVGMSGGAYRAAALVARGRIHVRAVALIGPIVSYTDDKREALGGFASSVRAGDDLQQAMVSLMLSPRGQAEPSNVADVATWISAYASPNILADELDAFARAGRDLRSALAGLGTRLLLRVGALDAATPPHLARELARRVPGARLEVVEGVGHALLTEDLRATSKSIEEFLSSVARDEAEAQC